MKPRQKHEDILPADSKGWGACRGSGRIRQGTGRGWGSVCPCPVSCFGRDMVGIQAFPVGASPTLHGNHSSAPSQGYGQLSVLVGAAAVTSLASVRPWEALCPRIPTQIHAAGHRHPCISLSPRPGRVGGSREKSGAGPAPKAAPRTGGHSQPCSVRSPGTPEVGMLARAWPGRTAGPA